MSDYLISMEEFSETNLEDLIKECVRKGDLIRDLQHQFLWGVFVQLLCAQV